MADEVQLLRNHIRLMRKDELIVVPTTKLSRSPQIHQRKLTEIKIPRRVSRVLSAVIENNCKLNGLITRLIPIFRLSTFG